MKIKLFILLILSFKICNAQWEFMKGPNVGTVNCVISNGADVYVSALDNSSSYVFHSVDSGLTWEDPSVFFARHNCVVKYLILKGDTLFAGGNQGVFYSSDKGSSWVSTNPGSPWMPVCYGLVTDGTNIYSACGTVYKTTDNGVTWIESDAGMYPAYVTHLGAGNGVVLAATDSNGVFRSTDQGVTWSSVGPFYLTSEDVTAFAFMGNNTLIGTATNGVLMLDSNYNIVNIFAPGYAQKVNSLFVNGSDIYVGCDSGIYSTSDTGATWSQSNVGTTAQYVTGIDADSPYLFCSAHGGFFRSSDNGNTWEQTGCPSLRILAFNQLGDFTFSGGSAFDFYDNGGLFMSTDSGITWSPIHNGLPSPNAVGSILVVNSKLIIGTMGSGYYSSSDTGNSWTAINNGIVNFTNTSFVEFGNVYLSSSSRNALNLSALYRSTDSGSNWNDITPWSSSIYSASIAKFGTELFALTDTNIYYSADTGNTWNISSPGVYPLYNKKIAKIGTDYYMCGLSDIPPDYPTLFFVSSDNGLTWSQLNIVPPTNSMNACVFFINNYIFFQEFLPPSRLFISTDLGNSWNDISDGLNEGYIYTLNLIGDYLFAGTIKSVYRRRLSETLLTLGKTNPISQNDDFGIYPNPVTDYFYVELKLIKTPCNLEIFNSVGEKIHTQIVTSETSRVDYRFPSAGIYFVRAYNDKIFSSRRIVVIGK